MNDERWLWDWSADRRRAFIVDSEGFLVIGPILSKRDAQALVRKHNQAVERLSHA